MRRFLAFGARPRHGALWPEPNTRTAEPNAPRRQPASPHICRRAFWAENERVGYGATASAQSRMRASRRLQQGMRMGYIAVSATMAAFGSTVKRPPFWAAFPWI